MPADCVEQARDPPEMIDGAGFRRFAVSLVADDEWLKSPVVFSFWRVPPFEQEVRFVLDQVEFRLRTSGRSQARMSQHPKRVIDVR